MKQESFSKEKNNIIKGLIISTIILFIIIGLIPVGKAELTAYKKTDKREYQTGETTNITLIINNTYDEDIKVIIRDENIIANNGVIIKCLERTIKKKTTEEIPYSIILTKPGEYTIQKANISYEYEGKEKEIRTKPINITIKGEENNQMQQITEIYDCGGIKSRSTSIISGGMGGTSISLTSNNGGIQIRTNLGNNIPSINSVLPTNDNESKGEKEKIHEMIRNNELFQQAEEKLNKEGYILQKRIINKTNKGYNFQYYYKNGEEWKAITGMFQNKSNDNETGIISNLRIKKIRNDKEKIITAIIILITIITIIMAGNEIKRKKQIRRKTKKKTKETKEEAIVKNTKKTNNETNNKTNNKETNNEANKEETIRKEKEKIKKTINEKTIKEEKRKETFTTINKELRRILMKKLLIKESLTDKELLMRIKNSKLENKEAIIKNLEKIIRISEEARFANNYNKKSLGEIKETTRKILKEI